MTDKAGIRYSLSHYFSVLEKVGGFHAVDPLAGNGGQNFVCIACRKGD